MLLLPFPSPSCPVALLVMCFVWTWEESSQMLVSTTVPGQNATKNRREPRNSRWESIEHSVREEMYLVFNSACFAGCPLLSASHSACNYTQRRVPLAVMLLLFWVREVSALRVTARNQRTTHDLFGKAYNSDWQYSVGRNQATKPSSCSLHRYKHWKNKRVVVHFCWSVTRELHFSWCVHPYLLTNKSFIHYEQIPTVITY